MDRKMRAKRNNAEAKSKKERRNACHGIVFTTRSEGQEVNQLHLCNGDTVPVLVDHEARTYEPLPKKSEMN